MGTGTSDVIRGRARYYVLTPAGERRLGLERAQWARLSGGVDRILGLT